ncbi:alkaline phosphatase PhoX [Persicitalea jodogahamensis]|uniref:Alkaline phosphatase n=1 Tax=Persicitalea jodogahamensis TaxID=402147 RepID=A0A8J3DCW1_9BACT|nr:alkaline phosphatase PhoX [Persicitalea jodogahamensis]GHB85049.1 hypothetical protein GCM10007390_45410 [Persicitalea jodogahamensis]
MKLTTAAGCALLTTAILAACINDHDLNNPAPAVALQNFSVNPSLIKTLPGFDNLEITTLISSDDVLPESPGFVFGGQPDGAGIIPNPAGDGFIMINNHEYLRSVSRVYLDKNFKPTKGEYIVNYDGGTTRLCSATMATPAEHGFGPVFLTAGESGAESMVHAINPTAPADPGNPNRVLPALGKASMENAVPLPKTAYPGKTVIIIGEDDGNGQLIAYVSSSVGDLQNGKLYMLRRKDQNTVETNMKRGEWHDVEFVEIDNAKTSTGAQIAAQTVAKKAIQFTRVEDVDYGKGSAENARNVYFTATGQASNRKDPVPGKTMWGRVYHLQMDANDPLKGKLELIVDGDETPSLSITNPDNICVTQNFVYIQEDGDSFYLDTKHDGRIWQYDIATKELKPMLEMNHRRGDAAFQAKYNPLNVNLLSSWEYGAMYDVSDLTGIPNTFAVNIHPHTWRSIKYAGVDGSAATKTSDLNESFTEGGQVVIVRGVAK